MKNKTKVMIGLAVASLATLALAACSGSTNRYGQYEKDGYGIRVRYYSNGGQFASTADVDLVDVYKLPESGGIRLIEPGSDERGPKGEKTQIAYTGHFLAGWYQTRTEITDVNGEKTYSYSDPWDFKNDRLTVDKDKTFEEDEAALSLYAVWVPNFTYTFYAQSGAEWEQIGQYVFNPQTSPSEIVVPEWDVEGENATGRMDYHEFPKRSGMTFENAYLDKDMTQPCGETVVHGGSVVAETGTAKDGNLNVYTTWKNGDWYKISTVSQLQSNISATGCYELLSDTYDFTDETWSVALSEGAFTGKFVSETGCTFKNINIIQTDSQKQFGGLFGQIREEAEIKNVSFENVTYRLNAATRLVGGAYGVLAGTLSENATVENVTVSGQMLVGAGIATNFSNYTVGLLTGNGVAKGISFANITADVVKMDYVTPDTYPYKLAVDRLSGIITISENESAETKPDTVYN